MTIQEAEKRVQSANFRFYSGYGEEIETIINAIKNGYKLYRPLSADIQCSTCEFNKYMSNLKCKAKSKDECPVQSLIDSFKK